MSSWKKASKINQKTHRERHQPESRAHLGLLEKKKDYKKRADDYNKKQALLKKLKIKAQNKSPDEFYFHMINSKVVDGVHKEKREDKHTPEQIKLMESKDLNYIGFRKTIEAKKIDKLQSQLHLIDEANTVKNSHVFFVDSENEVKEFDLAKRLDTHPDLIPRRTNRLTTDELQHLSLPSVNERTALKLQREKERAYNQLHKRIRREKQLTIVQNKLETHKALKAKVGVKPVKVKNATKGAAAVYQWPYVRKR
ncbi:probable U3 small nucleolar RNA-associated protein 11 [Macrosteles quadrilineatus]|uniref:probable U3 small nucleolar RNA-associated protein 11 n=1 Tax=Macrosteles quadrilineatus TaxID=74068 RepID=UPI0023E0B025|nr:probable U3 small nucleolar RNA-associated protein 11 [Macrosteles quadrilineatus]XP_054278475.1 probable U3 small nucleolar RNA-associated protein 11 [Macrosteles quadrilineatus]